MAKVEVVVCTATNGDSQSHSSHLENIYAALSNDAVDVLSDVKMAPQEQLESLDFSFIYHTPVSPVVRQEGPEMQTRFRHAVSLAAGFAATRFHIVTW